jgi:hypothetical protein
MGWLGVGEPKVWRQSVCRFKKVKPPLEILPPHFLRPKEIHIRGSVPKGDSIRPPEVPFYSGGKHRFSPILTHFLCKCARKWAKMGRNLCHSWCHSQKTSRMETPFGTELHIYISLGLKKWGVGGPKGGLTFLNLEMIGASFEFHPSLSAHSNRQDSNLKNLRPPAGSLRCQLSDVPNLVSWDSVCQPWHACKKRQKTALIRAKSLFTNTRPPP